MPFTGGNDRDSQGDIRTRQLRLVPGRRSHGAGARADGDVTAVFITNKPFEINYVDRKTLKRQPAN